MYCVRVQIYGPMYRFATLVVEVYLACHGGSLYRPHVSCPVESTAVCDGHMGTAVFILIRHIDVLADPVCTI
eukprot:SAG11_NODE_7780_length_1097_cov_1.109218_3_plen_72_part_01